MTCIVLVIFSETDSRLVQARNFYEQHGNHLGAFEATATLRFRFSGVRNTFSKNIPASVEPMSIDGCKPEI
jgi:hypothetical protein